ncbi:TetR/AcrR family transcriptional regulator [Nocardioides sp.]|uniref:TetR/AcrR family transcriptional regulator n=1 Tax=Nocardioides sp. TaxID=35761 RepID=UPI0031FF389D|nr:TetR/AcrR family transcriptional regulator [Nocardioides sp.]
MSTPYHHGNLRAALVDAGLELARAKGPDGVVLREVARQVGVSHNAAYRHFADRDDLLLEIADRGMAELSGAMQARVDALPDELDAVTRARLRLHEVGRAYVEFALAEPGLFTAAFSCFSENAAGREPGSGPYEMLNAALDELVAVGYLAAARRPGAEVTCWAAVHGFSLLHLEGPMRVVDPADRDAALTGLLDTIDRGLGDPATG